MKFIDLLGKERLFFDGAMGTMLQKNGLSAGEIPETWNITHRETVYAIHKAYADAGCNIIKSNTFGANALKFKGQVRPLIVNSTNRKTLRKLFGDAKASTLVGKQIQLFVDHNVRDPQDGGMTDGIRIRPYKPRVQKQEPVPPCTDCKQPIEPAMGKDARWLAGYTIKHYGVPLCAACAQKRKEAASAAETQQEAETAAEMQQELDPEHIQVDPETGEVL